MAFCSWNGWTDQFFEIEAINARQCDKVALPDYSFESGDNRAKSTAMQVFCQVCLGLCFIHDYIESMSHVTMVLSGICVSVWFERDIP